MAKRSEIEAQMATLQAELDKADTDDEIWVKGDDGREYKVSGRRATAVLQKLGLHDILDAAGDGDGQADADTDAETDADPDPARTGGYFGRKSK